MVAIDITVGFMNHSAIFIPDIGSFDMNFISDFDFESDILMNIVYNKERLSRLSENYKSLMLDSNKFIRKNFGYNAVSYNKNVTKMLVVSLGGCD